MLTQTRAGTRTGGLRRFSRLSVGPKSVLRRRLHPLIIASMVLVGLIALTFGACFIWMRSSIKTNTVNLSVKVWGWLFKGSAAAAITPPSGSTSKSPRSATMNADAPTGFASKFGAPIPGTRGTAYGNGFNNNGRGSYS
jgi:hypothetical protein